MRRAEDPEMESESPAPRSTQHRVILIPGVLLMLSFISLAIRMSFLFINLNSSCCPEGWITIGSKCYYFQNTTATWERSQEECAKNYSILLILKDKDELDSLLPFMEHTIYWLGLRREAQNNSRWVWVDGTALTFSLWYEGEPNNRGGGENCAEIWRSSRSANDIPCDTEKRSICKAQSRCV